MSLSIFTVITFLDLARASRTVVGPENFSSKFLGFQSGASSLLSVFPASKTMGESMTIVAGVYSLSRAAAYIIGLKALPGWRFACTALLNLLFAKSIPPTRALTKPVSVSTASNAPSAKGSCSSLSASGSSSLSETFFTPTHTTSPSLNSDMASETIVPPSGSSVGL